MKKIEIKAPAKINIGLYVINKREDGYHNIHTLFYPLFELYDKLIFEKAGNKESAKLTCSVPELPLDENNLIIKAKMLLEKVSGKKFNAHIHCEKNIPSGAGLGGGSSDAAATLISLNELFDIHLPYDKLHAIATKLGSDVPFFLKSKPAIGTSRGEILKLVDVEINKPVLIVNPGIHISTAEAYKNVRKSSEFIAPESLITDGKIDLQKADELLENHFEDYAFGTYPELTEITEVMKQNSAVFTMMSGSGSTMFAFFNDHKSADKCKSQLPENYLKLVLDTDLL